MLAWLRRLLTDMESLSSKGFFLFMIQFSNLNPHPTRLAWNHHPDEPTNEEEKMLEGKDEHHDIPAFPYSQYLILLDGAIPLDLILDLEPVRHPDHHLLCSEAEQETVGSDRCDEYHNHDISPDSDVSRSVSGWAAAHNRKLEHVTLELDNVANDGEQRRERECRCKQGDVSIFDYHLQIIVKGFVFIPHDLFQFLLVHKIIVLFPQSCLSLLGLVRTPFSDLLERKRDDALTEHTTDRISSVQSKQFLSQSDRVEFVKCNVEESNVAIECFKKKALNHEGILMFMLVLMILEFGEPFGYAAVLIVEK
mmetsp:Transcript_28979/g.54258  ORF Transcript_28979/g.54258 Transcript_28979/m.54258 type:complete len:308 (-) Transcript_28979:77-1000(-)